MSGAPGDGGTEENAVADESGILVGIYCMERPFTVFSGKAAAAIDSTSTLAPPSMLLFSLSSCLYGRLETPGDERSLRSAVVCKSVSKKGLRFLNYQQRERRRQRRKGQLLTA